MRIPINRCYFNMYHGSLFIFSLEFCGFGEIYPSQYILHNIIPENEIPLECIKQENSSSWTTYGTNSSFLRKHIHLEFDRKTYIALAPLSNHVKHSRFTSGHGSCRSFFVALPWLGTASTSKNSIVIVSVIVIGWWVTERRERGHSG